MSPNADQDTLQKSGIWRRLLSLVYCKCGPRDRKLWHQEWLQALTHKSFHEWLHVLDKHLFNRASITFKPRQKRHTVATRRRPQKELVTLSEFFTPKDIRIFDITERISLERFSGRGRGRLGYVLCFLYFCLRVAGASLSRESKPFNIVFDTSSRDPLTH